MFLVPADNCDEARTVAEDTMELIKVETLTAGRRRAARP